MTLDLAGGEKWRTLRKHLSPTFTSGKLKGMMGPMQGVADDMMRFIDESMKQSRDGHVDMKAVFQGR